MGSSGPASTNPATGEPWGLDFPVITIRDMVRAQAMLLDHLGIASLFSVAGGSMGGMQVLQWTASYPERVFSALPLAAATRHSAQNIAFHEVGRQAIMADPNWRGGDYYGHGKGPEKGLAVARMAAKVADASAVTLRIGKEAFYRQVDLPEDAAYEQMRETMATNAMTCDAQEGMSAFLAKRDPVWQHHD